MVRQNQLKESEVMQIQLENHNYQKEVFRGFFGQCSLERYVEDVGS